MADYERSHSKSIPPDALFVYLSDVRNLRAYSVFLCDKTRVDDVEIDGGADRIEHDPSGALLRDFAERAVDAAIEGRVARL